jgi:hypothetical protein
MEKNPKTAVPLFLSDSAQQLDGADPASRAFGFSAILALAGRAAHLEAVRRLGPRRKCVHMPTQQQLLDAIAPRLEPAEQVFALVLGRMSEEKFDSIIALTSRRLLLSSPTRGSSIQLGNIKAITWSGLWSSLNIDLRQPTKRIVVGVSGPEWKQRARSLVEEAKSLIAEAEK